MMKVVLAGRSRIRCFSQNRETETENVSVRMIHIGSSALWCHTVCADPLREEEPIVSSRMAIHWPDRHLWGERVLFTRAWILDLIDRYPWASGMVAVPLTIIALSGMVAYPFLFGPLLVLLGVALVAIEYYADQQQTVGHQAEAAGGARKWNLPTRISYSGMQDRLNMPRSYTEAIARMDAAEAKVRAADARARAAAAQVLADDAEKQSEVAQARVAQLRLEAKAKAEPTHDVD